jgi:hypothetical protein
MPSYRKRLRNRDPYWLTCRRSGKCARCKDTIEKGDEAFYYPSSRALYCDEAMCGQDESMAWLSFKGDDEGIPFAN